MEKGTICAFCTAFTTYKPTRVGAHGVLQQFYKEFISSSGPGGGDGGGVGPSSSRSARRDEDKLPENWALCTECLPHVQGVVGRREKVNRVEAQVRKLQGQILRELSCLVKEVHGMWEEMRVVQGIMKNGGKERKGVKGEEDGRSRRRKKTEDDELINRFREKVDNVLLDLENFNKGSSGKLFLDTDSSACSEVEGGRRRRTKENVSISKVPKYTSSEDRASQDKRPYVAITPDRGPEPVIKLKRSEATVKKTNNSDGVIDVKIEVTNETENDLNDADDFMDDNNDPGSPPNSPPEDLDPGSPMELDDDIAGDNDPKPNDSKAVKTRPPQTKTKIEYVSDSEDDSSAKEDSDDEDFDPEDRAAARASKRSSLINKNMSIFRKNLITVVQDRNSVSTSKFLPSSREDPRRKYAIHYNPQQKKFFLEDVELICLDDEQTLQCSKCDAKFKPKNKQVVESFIFDHVLGHHLNAYTCTICSAVLKCYSSYCEHKEGHEENISCDICGKPLGIRSSIVRHKWLHLNEQERADPANAHMIPHRVKRPDLHYEFRFQCSECGKAFKKNGQLQKHMDFAHNNVEREKAMCPDCGVVVFKEFLAAHQRRCQNHIDKGVSCPLCQIMTKNRTQLENHFKQVHPNERLYSCDHCGKGFKTTTLLKTHMESHSEGRNHICKFCGSAYKQRRNLQRHERECGGGRAERETKPDASNNASVKYESEQEMGSFDQMQFQGNYM